MTILSNSYKRPNINISVQICSTKKNIIALNKQTRVLLKKKEKETTKFKNRGEKMQKAQNFGQKLIQNPITRSKQTGKSIYFKAHAKSMRINTYRREREREKERG